MKIRPALILIGAKWYSSARFGPSTAPVNISIKDSHHIALLSGICALLFFVDLGGRDIWDIDEGMHAAMAQTMVHSGDWITPMFNGEAFFDKPALFNWLTALSFLVFGFTEFAARLPAALSGLGCVLLTYVTARHIYGPRAALLAGIVMATSLEIILLSRVVQYDIPFTFFTTLSLYFCTRCILDEDRRAYYIAGFYAAGALAVLVKGPIGMIVPGMAFFAYLVYARKFAVLKTLFMPPGLLVFTVIVAPWFLLMEQANSGYLDYFIVRQHFGNFLGGEGALQPRHPEPFYYYIPVLLGGLLPWSLLLPGAMFRATGKDRDHSDGAPVFLAIWIAVIFLFFSAATSKLGTYLLPLFPAAAILTGRYCASWIDSQAGGKRRLPAFTFAALAVLLVLFTAFAVVTDPWTYWKFRTGINWWDFELFMYIMTALFVLVFVLEWLSRYRQQFFVLAAISPFLAFYILWVIVPGADPYKGAKDIGMAMDRRLPEDAKFYFSGQMLDSAIFYADRNAVMLHTDEEMIEYMQSDERVYALVRTRAREQKDAFTGDYEIIEVIGNKAIVSNQPDHDD